MNKVDKQFSKLDKKATKLKQRYEKELKSKGENKAIKPLFVVFFSLSLLLICFSGYLYTSSFLNTSISRPFLKYISFLPFVLLILAFIISIFIKSKFTAYIILSLAYIDTFVFVWSTIDKRYVKNQIHILILSVAMFLIATLILLRLVSYRRNKYLK